MADRAYVQPDVITTKGPQIDVRSYGSDKNRTTLLNALSAIGPEEIELIIPPGEWDLTGGNITFSSNITLRFLTGAHFNVPSGVNVEIEGAILAGSYQIFYGTGNVTVFTYPQNNKWWGLPNELIIDKATILDLTANISEQANRELLTSDKHLLYNDPKVQFLDPNGIDRNIFLPAESLSEGNKFWISNIDSSTYRATLFVYMNDSTSLISIIKADQSCLIACDDTEWRSGVVGSGLSGSGGGLNWTIISNNTTAESNNGYLVDCSLYVITIELPESPKEGDKVGIKDFTANASTNNITIDRNGSLIEGSSTNFIINKDLHDVVFVYTNSIEGWVRLAESLLSEDQKRSITYSTSWPSGGENGDFWVRIPT